MGFFRRSSCLLITTCFLSTIQVTFTANPSSLQETGSDTGVFQTVITLPVKSSIGTTAISNTLVKHVTLTYVDVGLSW